MRRSYRLLVTVLSALLLLLTLQVPSAQAAPPNTVRNPLRDGTADPFMFRHDGAYYLTYTAVDRIILVRSTSVAGLATAPAVTVWQDGTAGRCCDIWAPEFHFLNGRWYVYYTAAAAGDIASHRMFVLESSGTDPMGPYTFKAKLGTQNDFSIDGTILKLNDGRLFHVWSGHLNGSPQSLYIASMSNPWTHSSGVTTLSAPTYAWERHGLVNEGPIALIRGNRTFVVYSGSGCSTPDYALGLLELTGSDPLSASSWTKSPNPVFRRNDAGWVFGPGHNSFFPSPDGTEVWNAYHAVTSSSGAPYGSCGGDRSLRIDKVTFDAAGTPNFGVPSASWLSIPLPAGDPGVVPVANGTYKISPANNLGNTLDVLDCVPEDGADVSVWHDVGSVCQRWNVTYLDDGTGTYKITNASSGDSLDVAGCSPDNHANVIQWPYWGGDCQRWYLDALPGGFFRITSKVGGRALDVDTCATVPRIDVRVWNYWGADCQRWQLQHVAG